MRPTYQVDKDGSLPFVDLTVCPSFDFAFKKDVMNRYGLDSTKYRKEGEYTPENNDYSNMDLHKTFDHITHEIYEILLSIRIFTLDHEHSVFLVKFNENETEPDLVKIVTTYQPNLGKCYSIQPKEMVLKLGIRVVEFVARIGIYVYLGYPGQFTHHITKTKVHIDRQY